MGNAEGQPQSPPPEDSQSQPKGRGRFAGRKHTEETRAKIAEASKRPRKPLSEEHKAKIRASKKGKSLPPEHRAAISKGLEGHSSALKGRELSEETRERMSEAHKGVVRPPEVGRKVGAANRERFTPEVRARMSEATKLRLALNKYLDERVEPLKMAGIQNPIAIAHQLGVSIEDVEKSLRRLARARWKQVPPQ